MFGSVYTAFIPESVDVDPSIVEDLQGKSSFRGDDSDRFKAAIAGSKLNFLTAANNLHNDDSVRPDNGHLKVRFCLRIDPRTGRLRIDPRTGRLDIEDTLGDLTATPVTISCRVSVQGQMLKCGRWSNDDHTVGVIITTDPSKDDSRRRHIKVLAPTLTEAREALIATLTGQKVPQEHWLL